MPKFVIERNMPGAGNMSESDFKEAAEKSCEVLKEMGPEIQWVESFVTNDKIFCVYHAENESLIREHGKKAGFPTDTISRVIRVIDPTTAEGPAGHLNKSTSTDQLIRQ